MPRSGGQAAATSEDCRAVIAVVRACQSRSVVRKLCHSARLCACGGVDLLADVQLVLLSEWKNVTIFDFCVCQLFPDFVKLFPDFLFV